MKLAGGSTRLAAEIDRDEFLRQIREYEDVDRSTLDRAYKILLTIQRTHPFAMQRAKQLRALVRDGLPGAARRASRRSRLRGLSLADALRVMKAPIIANDSGATRSTWMS